MSTFQDRLAARPPVPHSRDCRLCYPPEGSLVRGVLSALALEIGVGALLGAAVVLFLLFGGTW